MERQIAEKLRHLRELNARAPRKRYPGTDA